MTQDHKLEKVEILLNQKKYAEAENILIELLNQDPNNIGYLALLAEVNLQQDNYIKASEIINNSIGLSPDNSHLFYIKARINLHQQQYNEAEISIRQAISIEPDQADYHALLAHTQIGRKQFNEALASADTALEIDAENLLALNTRSTALLKLNRTDESFETINGALREDPNNSYTHANYGWGLLEKGDHQNALIHFKEALSKDPTSEYAQAGMIESLKASNVVYRLFLKYSFWMGNLTEKYQWGVLIGFFFVVRFLRTVAKSNEELEPYLTPLIIGLGLLAFSTWIINPIGNLFLRFNKYGQVLLSKSEKISSNFVAISFICFIIGVLLFFILSDERMLAIAVWGFTMMLPLGIMYSPSKNENALLIYTASLAIVGMLAVVLTFATGEMFNLMTIVYLIGFFAFQWVANYMIIKESNH
jgi:tetratricopeptide (TPR) repeat protein